MFQKLLTNPREIEPIMLDELLMKRTASTVKNSTVHEIATATATLATTIKKPLNLDTKFQNIIKNTKQQRKGYAMSTGTLNGIVQQKFTRFLMKATNTTAAKVIDAFNKTNNTSSGYIGNIANSTTYDTMESYENSNSSTKSFIDSYTTFIDLTSIISSSRSSIVTAATSTLPSFSSTSALTPTTITMPLDATSTATTTVTTTASSLIAGSFAGTNSSNVSSLISTTSIKPESLRDLLCLAWPKAFFIAIFLLLILVTIVGNTLVILAVLTTRRLRTVTNCFVMNLAITDWLVGTCVMPPAVYLYCTGTWQLGWILCDIWISLDVLLCTGSILSLCAISLDRYLAVTQPLTYSKKRRSKRLALFMIFIVWISALSITCPPYLGWYEPGRRKEGNVVCRYNQNKGYVVFSAMGSFFIPLAVMMYVYLKIGFVLTSRRQRIVRDANSERTADHEIDCDNFLSESEHFQCATPKFPSFRIRWTINGSKKNSLRCEKCNLNHMEQVGLRREASFYELVEISRLSSLIHCSAISCKYGGPCIHSTPLGVRIANGSDSNGSSFNGGIKHSNTLPKLPAGLYNESRATFSDTCLTTTAALQNVEFNDELHQQNENNHHQQTNYNNHQHHNQQLNGHHLHHGQQNSNQQHHHQHQQQHHPHHHHHHPHRVPMRISTTKRDTKTTKTLTIVMGGFAVCWLPFFVYYLLIPFLPPAAVIEGLQTFLTWVGWVNCAINPFIYAFYNPDFRIAFWRLTCRRICKQKPTSNHIAMFRG